MLIIDPVYFLKPKPGFEKEISHPGLLSLAIPLWVGTMSIQHTELTTASENMLPADWLPAVRIACTAYKNGMTCLNNGE